MLSFCLALLLLPAVAQRPQYHKLSPMLRKMARGNWDSGGLAPGRLGVRGQNAAGRDSVCAFVRVATDGEQTLRDHGCRVLTRVDDICIANIPRRGVAALSLEPGIVRMEASHSVTKHRDRGNRLQTDSLGLCLNAKPVYEGRDLPQAYTGKGVVVGVMDIGFDLTHPNFYSRDTTEYRIKQLWDMISADTVGSTLPVGRDYVGKSELLALKHCRDGLDQTHGTHTLGIAAGSGYNSPYRGLAPESDICIVANAVTDDIVYIDSADYYKYTSATDALGFKYIMDYAAKEHKPCVISFSEGGEQDFWGYSQLYYEMLGKLTGPGRIIVSAAGNEGGNKSWFRKPAGVSAAGTFIRSYTSQSVLTAKSALPFTLRVVGYYGEDRDTLLADMGQVVLASDSVLNASLHLGTDSVKLLVEAYPSCYSAYDTCYDITLESTRGALGSSPLVSVEVLGARADVEVFRVEGTFFQTPLNPQLSAGERSHNVLSPASAPCVICVGGTYYRPGIVNYQGEWKPSPTGEYGEWGAYSSVGPTFDGRIKPDVVAPGSNIISSYSSYYLQNHPKANDLRWDVAHFGFNGRTYAWNSSSGTSMSCPAVAGAIALWLQAKPDLTMEEVIDVFSHTCRHYDEKLSYPNNYYGYGEIDVYHGLLYLLEASNIAGVSTRHTRAAVSVGQGRIQLSFGSPLETAATIRVYDLKGRLLAQETVPAGNSDTSLMPVQHQAGVVVVQVNGPAAVAGSSLVRL